MSEKKVIKIKNNIKTSEEVIIIKNLKLNAKFGYYPREKITEQELIFNYYNFFRGLYFVIYFYNFFFTHEHLLNL